MSNKIKIINEAKNMPEEIFIEKQNEEYLILSNSIDKSKFPYDTNTYMDHLDYCYNNDLYIGFPVGTIKTMDDLKSNNLTDYSFYYSKVNKNCNDKNLIIKPAGTYVVGYLKGYYIKAPIIYKKLMDYINENNLTLAGYAYEDVLIDEVAVKDTDEFVLKVSIHIK